MLGPALTYFWNFCAISSTACGELLHATARSQVKPLKAYSLPKPLPVVNLTLLCKPFNALVQTKEALWPHLTIEHTSIRWHML